MKTKTIALLALAALSLAVLAGCAQDSTDTTDDNPRMQLEVMKEKSGAQSTNPTRSEAKGGTEGTVLTLAADPGGLLKYEPTSLSAKAGKVEIRFTNDSKIPHDVAVAGKDGKDIAKSEEITEGSTDLVIKDLKPGTYQFYCTVPGHKQAGMVGDLTVR